MRYFAVAAMLLLACSLAFPSFTFLYSANGSLPTDTDDYYKLSQPTGLYMVGSSLYLADSGRGMIFIMNSSANLSRTKVMASPDSEAYLTNPMHMQYESSTGMLYIAGGSTGNILYFDGEGSKVDKWNVGTTSQQKIAGLALTNDTIYVTDTTKGQVVAFSRTTKSYSKIMLQPGGSDGQLSAPQDILLHNGRFYISDSVKGLIFVYDSSFKFLNITFGRGKGGLNLGSPRGMDFDDNRIYVADATRNAIVAFSLDGYPVDVLNASTANGSLAYPEDVIVDNGKLYVADTGNRLIKVFAITKDPGDPTVLAMITGANTTCAGMVSTQAVASKLNISISQVAYSQDLADAQGYYDGYQFSYASSLAQKAKSACASAQSSLTQSMDLRIKQLVQSSQAVVSPYRNISTTSASQLVQFDNKVAAVNSALGAKSYSSAADVALTLPSLAKAIATGSDAKADIEDEKRQNQSLAGVGAEITALSGRLSRLQEKSDLYRQGVNLSGSLELLVLAQEQADAGDFTAANRSIQLAAVEITTYETSISEAARGIDDALSRFAIVEFEFNTIASQPMLLGPDLSGEKKTMAQAKETIYSSPELAMQMAAQAKTSANVKSRDSQALSLAVMGVAVMLFFIALIAFGFLWHINSRRHKGL